MKTMTACIYLHYQYHSCFWVYWGLWVLKELPGLWDFNLRHELSGHMWLLREGFNVRQNRPQSPFPPSQSSGRAMLAFLSADRVSSPGSPTKSCYLSESSEKWKPSFLESRRGDMICPWGYCLHRANNMLDGARCSHVLLGSWASGKGTCPRPHSNPGLLTHRLCTVGCLAASIASVH
jgi:hypothetical protein